MAPWYLKVDVEWRYFSEFRYGVSYSIERQVRLWTLSVEDFHPLCRRKHGEEVHYCR